jgi:hypothetical protein
LELEDSGPIRIADIAPTARKKPIALNHAEGFFLKFGAVGALRGGLSSRRAI